VCKLTFSRIIDGWWKRILLAIYSRVLVLVSRGPKIISRLDDRFLVPLSRDDEAVQVSTVEGLLQVEEVLE
jgi:hypothetical protein